MNVFIPSIGDIQEIIPSIGDIQEIIVPGNRFRLEGLDFCDGTLITLQATRNNGSDKSLQLDIDSLQYPNISVEPVLRKLQSALTNIRITA